MRFLLFTEEEIICGDESANELVRRIQKLGRNYKSLTMNDALEFQSLPHSMWGPEKAVILVEVGLTLSEVKCFAVNWWIEEGN